MAKTFRDRVGQLLDIIRDPIATYGVDRLQARFGDEWRQGAFDFLGDRRHGGTEDDPQEWDIQAWLNFYIGSWNQLFGEILSNADRSRVFELKDTRNNWAHQKSFDFDKTYRAYDNAQLLLEAINSPAADAVVRLKEELQREKFSQPTKKTIVKIKSNPKGTLKPWRSVAVPHEDVQRGVVSASEFAADLWEVYKATNDDAQAQVSKEYADPKTFFGRTYLTDGLRALLRAGLRRLSNRGGEPVIQLQTNFGGGKTHSMLAIYHVVGGVPAHDLPGVDSFLSEEQLTVPKSVRRAVIVGNKIQPGAISTKTDGTKVHTLWGEIAWQLGGKAGYEMVRSADEQATNPGDALTALLKKFSPAIILIDEWVSYARQLYNRSDLKACGTFDTQFTFAQTLTEAAKIAGGVVLVVSLPQSELEVGSDAGKETLDRLRTVVGRIESTWQPATRVEAFEIVRRRLFETTMDTTARAETIRAFQELYKNNPEHFPHHVREKDYLDQISNTYPIHPELFDYLYRTWSVIPGFQQTRGVLRLMAAVIHSLWDSGDTSLMIMPSLVPLDDAIVRTEFTKFLGTGWNNIIESEIDGANSIAANIDRENSALGQLGAARRASRTIFLSTSPLGSGNHPGIDIRTLKTSCVLPGEKPALFGDATGYLAAQSVHLYHENDLYWYSEQPTLKRLAEDRKNTIERDELYATVEEFLRDPKTATRGDFSRVHVAPRSPSDVVDEDRVALVILPPDQAHRRDDPDSEALQLSRIIYDSRGAAPRINKNMIVFAAADALRLEELLEAVGWFKSWSEIVHQIDHGHPSMENVTRGQAESARAELQGARSTLVLRLPETYRWMLLPSQAEPGTPVEIVSHQVSGDQAIAPRISQFLAGKQWMMSQMDGPALRFEMDQIPLWGPEGYVSVAQLSEYFARYVYLPRIASRDTLIEAILDGVASLTWNPQTFAFADGFDSATGRFSGLVAGTLASRTKVPDGVIVKPENAQAQIDRDASAQRSASDTESSHDLSSVRENGPATGDQVGTHDPTTSTDEQTPEKVFRRFFGTVSLDPNKASTQMGTILEEILTHLMVPGSNVTVSLEVEAHTEQGFSENARRIVTQNARDLRFSQAEFEDD